MIKTVVIGAGGFGREVLDVLEEVNLHGHLVDEAVEVVGVLDDGDVDQRLLESYGVRHLGEVASLHRMPADVGYVIAIGNPAARAAIDAEFMAERHSPVLVHSTATMGRDVALSPGTIICAGVRLTTNIRLGRHVHVNLNCTVGHDTVLDDYVTLSPLVALSGCVHAKRGAFFGTGAAVNPGVVVDEHAVVGSGAAVIKPVESASTVVGVPARAR